MRRLLATLLTLILLLGLAACAPAPAPVAATAPAPTAAPVQTPAPTPEPTPDPLVYLKLDGWDATVKKGINDMFDMFGRNSDGYDEDKKPYAVFDFDNTVSILDVEEILAIYQLEHLRFAVKPEEMKEVLLTGIPENMLEAPLAGYPAADGSELTITQVATDAANAYAKLVKKGYVSPDNNLEAGMEKWMQEDDWKEFASKMRWMYDAIGENMDVSISYPWITYWFTGMTPEQVYKLAVESHAKYLAEGAAGVWEKRSFTGPEKYKSIAGPLSISYKYPAGITDELRELIAALGANGFDVWVCSASYIDVIEAICYEAQFGLSNIDGVVAMTNKVANGVYDNAYDYDLHAQTQGVGKSETIDKVIRPQYGGKGPVFTAMDSQGDFNFCSEYKDTAVTLILNRQRTDDAALLACAAVWQKEKGVDLAGAQKSGDTLFLLQGRDENKGKLLPQAECINLGKDSALLLAEKAQGWYDLLVKGTYPSIKEFINDCTNITGKLKEYIGYKAR